MQIKYFQTAWNDIKNSPGWFGKLCLLALINFIPIFGQIVTFGYLYGWAREISWGTHAPMPASIFGNDDGKFWRRGWFLLVVSIVFTIIPSIVIGIGSGMQSAGLASSINGMHAGSAAASAGSAATAGIGSILYLVGFLLYVLVMLLVWVAYMRTTIYDRLSAGFQFGKIWKMFRHDTGGIFRIFGMNLLIGLIIGAIVSMVMLLVVFIGVALAAGASVNMGGSGAAASSVPMYTALAALGGIAVLVLLVITYFATVGTVFIEALTARALGYWTMQFDVPHWRGQDDPMPFEMGQQPAAADWRANPYQASAPIGASVQPDQQQQWQAPQEAQPWQQSQPQPQQEAPVDQPVDQTGVSSVPVQPFSDVQPTDAWQQAESQAAAAETPIESGAIESPDAGMDAEAGDAANIVGDEIAALGDDIPTAVSPDENK